MHKFYHAARELTLSFMYYALEGHNEEKGRHQAEMERCYANAPKLDYRRTKKAYEAALQIFRNEPGLEAAMCMAESYGRYIYWSGQWWYDDPSSKWAEVAFSPESKANLVLQVIQETFKRDILTFLENLQE